MIIFKLESAFSLLFMHLAYNLEIESVLTSVESPFFAYATRCAKATSAVSFSPRAMAVHVSRETCSGLETGLNHIKAIIQYIRIRASN